MSTIARARTVSTVASQSMFLSFLIFVCYYAFQNCLLQKPDSRVIPWDLCKEKYMSSKTLIWGGMFVGSTIGGLLPALWNADILSYTLWSSVGGIAGIWAGFKLAKATGIL